MGGALPRFESKVPGCKISKPVPCPRKTLESRLSKDGWDGSFAAIGGVGGRLRMLLSLPLGRELLLLLLLVLLMLPAELAGLESGEGGALMQNSVNGVTSGRLDLRTAGGRLSSWGDHNLVGELLVGEYCPPVFRGGGECLLDV